MTKLADRWRSYSENEFLSLVDNEHLRSRRYHVRFSLVVFDLSRSIRPGKRVRALVRSLSRRVRSADRIGWLGDEKVGLLLPATEANGATKVVEDILRSWRREDSPLCSIQSYPQTVEVNQD